VAPVFANAEAVLDGAKARTSPGHAAVKAGAPRGISASRAERRTKVYSNRFARISCASSSQRVALPGVRNIATDDVETIPPATTRTGRSGTMRAFWDRGRGDNYGVDTNETGTSSTSLLTRALPLARAKQTTHNDGAGVSLPWLVGARIGRCPLIACPCSPEDIPPLVFSRSARCDSSWRGASATSPLGRTVAPRSLPDYGQSYSFWRSLDHGQTRNNSWNGWSNARNRRRCTIAGRFLHGARRSANFYKKTWLRNILMLLSRPPLPLRLLSLLPPFFPSLSSATSLTLLFFLPPLAFPLLSPTFLPRLYYLPSSFFSHSPSRPGNELFCLPPQPRPFPTPLPLSSFPPSRLSSLPLVVSSSPLPPHLQEPRPIFSDGPGRASGFGVMAASSSDTATNTFPPFEVKPC